MSDTGRHISKGWVATWCVVAILAIDQAIKIWVKTHMRLHDSIDIASWFKISFIENNGMAFGMEIGSKLFLSGFRILAIVAMTYYIYLLVRQQVKWGYLICLSMVLAGAVGNVIDCMFYGLIFTPSTPYLIAEVVPFGEGYAPFLMGRVVDMFYFPLIETNWPEWMPFVGGEHFVFFSPVFNFADSCVSVGIVLLLIFYRKEISQITFRKPANEN